MRERFSREAKLAATLEHDAVFPIHEAGKDEGLLFVAMRYVQGRISSRCSNGRARSSLRGRLRSSLRSRPLDFAHARGVLHRDVKPANVLVEQRGEEERAYLCDFGLARSANASRLTSTGTVLGTVDYVSPEHVRGEGVDPAATCTRWPASPSRHLPARPYGKDDELATLWAHLHEQPPALTERRRNGVVGGSMEPEETVAYALAE
jgi:serine/threonine-protein kinase